MRSLPPKSPASFMATDMDNGYRDFPDMYISSLGSSFLVTSTGKVFVIFTPKARPSWSASAWRRFIHGLSGKFIAQKRRITFDKCIQMFFFVKMICNTFNLIWRTSVQGGNCCRITDL